MYDILRWVFIRFSLFSSIFNLIVMTLDRYASIFYSVAHRNRGSRVVCILVTGIWVLGFVCVIIAYCVTRWVTNGSRDGDLIFPILSFPATFVFLYCYTKIYLWIRKSNGNKNIKKEVI